MPREPSWKEPVAGLRLTGRVSGRTGVVSDRDADWGRHEMRGVDGRTGRAWTKVRSWFGYRVHLMADTRYEVPVSYRVEKASRSEVESLPPRKRGAGSCASPAPVYFALAGRSDAGSCGLLRGRSRPIAPSPAPPARPAGAKTPQRTCLSRNFWLRTIRDLITYKAQLAIPDRWKPGRRPRENLRRASAS